MLSVIKNLKFVRKVQFGFLLLGTISTLIALSDLYQINRMKTSKAALYTDFIEPKEHVAELYSEFQKTQFVMLKFSIEEFASEFKNNITAYNFHKEKIDRILDSLSSDIVSDDMVQKVDNIKSIWANYKNVVADAIISASASGMYDMAAVISTTSGEEVGNKLVDNFDEIIENLKYKSEKLNQEFYKAETDSFLFLVTGMITGTLVLLLSVFILAPKISKPIGDIMNIFKEFSLGNFNINIKHESDDEFGKLLKMADKFKDAQLEKINAAYAIADGSLEKVNEASDKDALAMAFNKEVTTLEHMLSEIDLMLEANEKGDLHFELNVENFSGGWSKVLEGFNKVRQSTLAPIDEARKVLALMAQGDFRTKMDGNYKGEYEKIKNDVNKVIISLNEIIGRVKISTEELASSANQIQSSTVEMAAGASEQNSQTHEVVSSIEEMTRTITESTRNATEASLTAEKAGNRARNGGKVVEETIEGINRIADVVIKSAVTIEELGRSSDQIGAIIKTINEIADQTNLLALNAAIEAARAGEHGRGFAVVADEVRKLAERTTGATNEITQMIKRIQHDTSGAVASIEKGKDEVERGKSLAGDAGNSLQEIITNTDEVTSLINQLAAASEEQNATSQQISQNVEMIQHVAQQNSDGTDQISFAAENLNKLTENLQAIVNKFQLASSSESFTKLDDYSNSKVNLKYKKRSGIKFFQQSFICVFSMNE
ncbi:MAG: MCP four helix bundle domain-containing protein [Ignavibacteriales bacterium]|nr:MCP four helix bundle domain-containing protein [Ignavibacteriales bacterium]